LAIHRKDYSVDIWFIAQHPKLLHVALRRQVGKHQHYRRLFGWGRAICYEWDQAQDNLAQTKTAVSTQFTYPKDVFKAYKSAEVHNKPKFKLPWWIWLPVAIIPAAAWAFPAAFGTLSSAMTGKGIHSSAKPALAAPGPVSVPAALSIPLTPPLPAVPYVPPPLPGQVTAAPGLEIAGCILLRERCGCFDAGGKAVTVQPAICLERSGHTSDGPMKFADTENAAPRVTPADLDVMAYMADQQRKRTF
jgi:zona occludens toxin